MAGRVGACWRAWARRGRAWSTPWGTPPGRQVALAFCTMTPAPCPMKSKNSKPVIDLVPAASLIVNGSAENDVFTYTSAADPANGLVTISDAESIEFSAKAHLILNGLGGSDQFSINNPNTPFLLADITINGGATS